MSGWTALYIFVACLVTYWLGYRRGRRDMERELFELAEQINTQKSSTSSVDIMNSDCRDLEKQIVCLICKHQIKSPDDLFGDGCVIGFGDYELHFHRNCQTSASREHLSQLIKDEVKRRDSEK